MARLIPLLPAPQNTLPVPHAQPRGLVPASAAALPAGWAVLPAPRTADSRSGQRRRVSRWVCDQYRAGGLAPDRGLLCDFST